MSTQFAAAVHHAPTPTPARTDHRAEVRDFGYTVVPGALDPREVGNLRRAMAAFLAAGEDCRYLYDGKSKANVFACNGDAVFLPLLRSERIAAALKEVAGGPVTFAREMGMGALGSAGWHKDVHGQTDVFDRARHGDFGVYKVLIYPQDQLGRTAEDFAIKVKRGSHWMPDVADGEEEQIFIRAGDAIIFDVRTTHRGQLQLGETWGKARRAAYFPIRRLAPAASYRFRESWLNAVGKTPRYLVTLLYGRCNSYTTRYIALGHEEKAKRWQHRADDDLPEAWRLALDSVGIRSA